MADKVERTGTRIVGFPDGELDFQLMRMLGAGNYGGAAPGEVFAARSAIGNRPEQWPAPFVAMATELDALAAQAETQFPVTARDHALRASMYWRCAEYFADPFGADCPRWGLASRASFGRAARHMTWRVAPFTYAFEGRQLPGYVMRPPAVQPEPATRPTLLIVTGFDGTAEELYFQAACAGLERGFQVVVAEGPGQMGTMREHPDLPFRPDYEAPIGAMIDHVLTLPGVDPDRLALYGISFGGYFAARAAAHDRRIRALILNSPIINLRDYLLGFMGDSAEAEDVALDEVDEVPEQYFPALSKHSFKAACRRFGVRSHFAWLDALKAFRVSDDQLRAITCPTLAMAGSGEGGEPEHQFQAFCQGAGGQTTAWRFDGLGSDMHCQMGNLPYSNAVVYDWLGKLWQK